VAAAVADNRGGFHRNSIQCNFPGVRSPHPGGEYILSTIVNLLIIITLSDINFRLQIRQNDSYRSFDKQSICKIALSRHIFELFLLF